MPPLVGILVTVGSAATIVFGAWHFFVPRIWDWYAYIDPKATELALAVRAVNFFFSLALVLFGGVGLLLVHGQETGRYALLVVLGATSILWAARVVMQVAHPQGTMNAALRYGMLATFAAVFCVYAVSLALAWSSKGAG